MNAFDKAVVNLKPGDLVQVPSPIPLPGFEKLTMMLAKENPKEFRVFCGEIPFGGLKQQEDGQWRFVRV